MRSEFEEWFKTTEAYKLIEEMNYFKVDLFTFKEHRSQYQHSAVQIAYMTYQHQQSKVDELQKQRDSFIKAYEIEIDENVELQKRVDASLIAFEKLKEEINELHGQCDLHLIKYLEEKAQELEQALKGGEDASN